MPQFMICRALASPPAHSGLALRSSGGCSGPCNRLGSLGSVQQAFPFGRCPRSCEVAMPSPPAVASPRAPAAAPKATAKAPPPMMGEADQAGPAANPHAPAGGERPPPFGHTPKDSMPDAAERVIYKKYQAAMDREFYGSHGRIKGLVACAHAIKFVRKAATKADGSPVCTSIDVTFQEEWLLPRWVSPSWEGGSRHSEGPASSHAPAGSAAEAPDAHYAWVSPFQNFCWRKVVAQAEGADWSAFWDVGQGHPQGLFRGGRDRRVR